MEGYNKGWRELFGVLIFEEGSGGSCSELLYWRRDIILAERYYIGGEILYWGRDIILAERYGGSYLELL